MAARYLRLMCWRKLIGVTFIFPPQARLTLSNLLVQTFPNSKREWEAFWFLLLQKRQVLWVLYNAGGLLPLSCQVVKL